MTILTNDELQAIRARCEAATPGPWKGDNGDVYTEWSREEYAEERGYQPEGTGFDEIRICEINNYNADVSDGEVRANKLFIAHARTDIPALLAHIAEQRWALSVLVEALEKTNAKERENALVEALEEIKNDIEDCDECRCDEVLVIARAALARVKGAHDAI